MFLSAHIAEASTTRAAAALRSTPDPAKIPGMRYAQTWMTASLRTGMLPSLAISGMIMIAAWDEDEALDRFLDHPKARPYADGFRVRLEPARSIGQLPGLPELPRQERPIGDGPVAAFTTGRVRANRMLPFLKAAGAAERDAATHPGMIIGVNLIRPPLIIGTFSLWRSVKEMRQYTLGSYPGGHAKAVAADKEKQFNHEMFFSRYIPYAAEGQWHGSNPLPGLEPAPVALPAPRNGRVFSRAGRR
ncbi:MAG TPA: hypothetical protein VLM05_07925 [Mycobacteriales bacterium]|nr:hypothetical protein [Mycobacteriales bacterium]